MKETTDLSKTTKPLRLGIIGGGRMGGTHAEFIAREEHATLTGVADPYNLSLAETYGVSGYADHRDLLAADDVDAVIIVNPNAVHVATALDCLSAGIPALLEKPVATSKADAARLAKALKDHGGRILVGHHRRHHPAVTAARDIIQGGGIGRVVAVSGMWLTRKDEGYFEQTWRRQRGGGVMLINLVHDLDLLRFLVGEVVSIQAAASNAVRGFEVEDTASVILEFENGALGSFVISDSVVTPWGWDQSTEDDPTFPYNPSSSCYSIAGTTGSLAFPQLTHYYHPGESSWTKPLSLRFDPKSTGNSYTNQLEHFIKVARGDLDPLVTVADATATLALIEAAGEAARSGQSVRIPLLS